jgi:hypothetical protein
MTTFDRENSSRRKLEIAAVRASGTPHVLLIGIVGALTLDFGCFSTYANMQNSERSARTSFQTGERPSLTSSPRWMAAFRHVASGCTIGGSSCKTLPSGICQRRESCRRRGTRTGSDQLDDRADPQVKRFQQPRSECFVDPQCEHGGGRSSSRRPSSAGVRFCARSSFHVFERGTSCFI